MYEDIKNTIRRVPDFPKKGIMFIDVTTLFKNSAAMKETVNILYDFVKDKKIDKVIGIESRGFVAGALLADKLNVGFVPIRKPGKLPAETIKETYELEYGSDTIEIHKDAIQPGEKVLIHDDLLATGGTAVAACKLVERLGGEVVQLSFIVELDFLKGREKLSNYDVKSIVVYDSE
jgi:adenine phosphoribosyltransferase